MQKALATLTEQGLLYSMRGSGMYVSNNNSGASEKIDEIKEQNTIKFIESMKVLGLSLEEIKEYVKGWKE